MRLLDKLKSEYNIDASELAIGDHKTKCPNCQPPHKKSDNPLSVKVSPDSIVFNCHHCGWSGGVNEGSGAKIIKTPRPAVFEKCSNDQMLSFFSKRGISPKTCEDHNIFFKNGYFCFPYNGKNGFADNIKMRSPDKKFIQTKDGKKSLYNYDHCAEAEQVVFVEGEMDVLSCWEAGVKSVTTLPDGAPATAAYKEGDKRFIPLKTHTLKATKIVLFVDADEAGENLRKELLHRYGKDACWYVSSPKDCKDANDVLVKHGPAKLKEIIDNARPYPIDGLYSVGNYESDVIDLYNGNYAKPVHIGYKALDSLYGVMKGTFHVWTGIPNHGKSTFLDQCLIELARNHKWKFAMFSPEHSTPMHIRRLVQIYLQKPFDKDFNGRMAKEELEEGLAWVRDHFYFIETREHIPNIKKILDIAGGAVRKHGINGIVIDPYNEVDASRSSRTREDEHIRDMISLCKRFARLHEVVFWVVAHPTKMQKNQNNGSYDPPTAYDIAGASHWHNQSDAVVTVHRDFQNHTMQFITRKIREQGLYGQIGEATFIYNHSKRIFEEPKIQEANYQNWN